MTGTPTPVTGATGSVDAAFEPVGVGLNVYESAEPVEGRVKWLGTPDEVIEFVQNEEDLENVIVVVRGGTTTFLTLALTAGIKGVITLQGAPESHLGILCREYGIPCIMSVAFRKGVLTDRGEIIPADGVRVRMDVSSRPHGTVSMEVGAPVVDPPAKGGPIGMDPEQAAQVAALLEKFRGEIPHGSQGDAMMRAELKTRVLYLDDDSFDRGLTVQEANELVRYLTWNEWDALAARATEGESGLIPRQEYEALGILNSWFRHPTWLRVIAERVGPQGLIEIGRKCRQEIGTKVNLLHSWAMLTAPSFGRGIALELGLHDEHFEAAAIVRSLDVVRRLYKGHWGDGPMFTSMRGYKAPLLDDTWIERFADDRIALKDPEAKRTFQRFNGTTGLMGFLLHFDNRLGMGDSGPYPLPNGGFVIVRDHFINEPVFPWAELSAELPYAVTQAMFFAPDSGLDVKVLDLSTLFTKPANYLPYVEGVAVYAREKYDTPMDKLKLLSPRDMEALSKKTEDVLAKLYKHIANMTQREKVLAGASVYTAGFALPYARAAGVLDDLIDSHGFFEVHPLAAEAYDRIVSGVATEMIPRLFLTGTWGVPLPEDLALR